MEKDLGLRILHLRVEQANLKHSHLSNTTCVLDCSANAWHRRSISTAIMRHHRMRQGTPQVSGWARLCCELEGTLVTVDNESLISQLTRELSRSIIILLCPPYSPFGTVILESLATFHLLPLLNHQRVRLRKVHHSLERDTDIDDTIFIDLEAFSKGTQRMLLSQPLCGIIKVANCNAALGSERLRCRPPSTRGG